LLRRSARARLTGADVRHACAASVSRARARSSPRRTATSRARTSRRMRAA
jgi:hypothetical protein